MIFRKENNGAKLKDIVNWTWRKAKDKRQLDFFLQIYNQAMKMQCKW